MAVLFTDVVGRWQNSANIWGRLEGDITRRKTGVEFTNLRLSLQADSAVSGSKSLGFWLGLGSPVQTKQFDISVTGTRDLGTFSLDDAVAYVSPQISSILGAWGSSDNYSGQFRVTFPAYPVVPTVQIVAKTATSITLKYGTTNFGVPNSGTVTLYGGTDSEPTTALDTYNATGDKEYTFTGLTPDTKYYFRAKAANSELESDYSATIDETTLKDVAMYGSVNNWAKEIIKIYGSLKDEDTGKNVTKEIIKIYGSVEGKTKRIF